MPRFNLISHEQHFDRSYAKVLHRELKGRDFFTAFYEYFLASSDEISEIFRNTDMEHQKMMLKKSFYSLLVFYASNAADDYLERLTAKHSASGINIPNHLYDLWMEALIETVKEFDDLCDQDTELAWRLILCGGITYMKYKQV